MRKFFDDPVYRRHPLQVLRAIWYGFFPPRGDAEASLTWGKPLVVDGEIGEGLYLLKRGVAQLSVTEACMRLARPGGTVIDVGANQGVMTSAFVQELSSGDTVYSYEPHPTTFSYLQRNMEAMKGEGSPVLIPKNKALSSEAGTITLFVPDEEKTRSWASLEENRAGEGVLEVDVEAVTLDDEIHDRVQVMKLDVEGHEHKVLEGGQELLRREKIKHIIFENHEIEDSRTADILLENGYDIKSLRRSKKGVALIDEIDKTRTDFVATLYPEECSGLLQEDGWRCI